MNEASTLEATIDSTEKSSLAMDNRTDDEAIANLKETLNSPENMNDI